MCGGFWLPAERLIYYVSPPQPRRRFSDGDPPMDFAGAALRVALDEDVRQEVREERSRWRKEIRESATNEKDVDEPQGGPVQAVSLASDT